MNERARTFLKIIGVVAFLYLFLISIQLMGGSLKEWRGFTDSLFEYARNPFLALLVGILATSIVQSSSITTSMVVSMVAGGLDVRVAIPIIMGANIGTSVTNLLVSIGHIHRRAEFQRAMSCASVHDIFNLITVAVLLPLEILGQHIWGVGYLEFLASKLTVALAGVGGMEKSDSIIKIMTAPLIGQLQGGLRSISDGKNFLAISGLVLSMILLFGSLYYIVKLMRSMVLKKVEVFFDRYVGAHWALAMGMGVVITILVQSSSITTSMLVPMAGAGILTLRQAFPITLGANLGTTVTSLLAALAAAKPAALTIFLVHFLFNLTGILMIYPIPVVRKIPMQLARRLAALCVRKRWFPFAFVGGVFFVVPILMILVWKLFSPTEG